MWGEVRNNIDVMGKDETTIDFYFKDNNYHLVGTKDKVANEIVDIISKNIIKNE